MKVVASQVSRQIRIPASHHQDLMLMFAITSQMRLELPPIPIPLKCFVTPSLEEAIPEIHGSEFIKGFRD